jgi:hypothetical protein
VSKDSQDRSQVKDLLLVCTQSQINMLNHYQFEQRGLTFSFSFSLQTMYAHNKLLMLKSPPVIRIDEIKTFCSARCQLLIHLLVAAIKSRGTISQKTQPLPLSIEWFGSNTILAYNI